MENLSKLKKLAGMKFHGGKTTGHWKKLTGVDPLDLTGLVSVRNGLCYWTPAAEKTYQQAHQQTAWSAAALGVTTC
jgi:hypothetical protein